MIPEIKTLTEKSFCGFCTMPLPKGFPVVSLGKHCFCKEDHMVKSEIYSEWMKLERRKKREAA